MPDRPDIDPHIEGHSWTLKDYTRQLSLSRRIPGMWECTFPELPAHMAQGATEMEALYNAERTARIWIDGCLARGQALPRPYGSAQDFPLELLLTPPAGERGAIDQNISGVTWKINDYVKLLQRLRVPGQDTLHLWVCVYPELGREGLMDYGVTEQGALCAALQRVRGYMDVVHTQRLPLPVPGSLTREMRERTSPGVRPLRSNPGLKPDNDDPQP